MVRAQGLFANGQRPLVERFRLGIFALIDVKDSQIVQACGDIGMIRTQGLFPNCQRPPVQRLCLGVFALIR